jgi:hypothetical protein
MGPRSSLAAKLERTCAASLTHEQCSACRCGENDSISTRRTRRDRHSLPGELRDYLERTMLACVAQQRQAGAVSERIVRGAFAVAARLLRDDPMVVLPFYPACRGCRSDGCRAGGRATCTTRPATCTSAAQDSRRARVRWTISRVGTSQWGARTCGQTLLGRTHKVVICRDWRLRLRQLAARCAVVRKRPPSLSYGQPGKGGSVSCPCKQPVGCEQLYRVKVPGASTVSAEARRLPPPLPRSRAVAIGIAVLRLSPTLPRSAPAAGSLLSPAQRSCRCCRGVSRGSRRATWQTAASK